MSTEGKGHGELSRHAQTVAGHLSERIVRLEASHTEAANAQLATIRTEQAASQARLAELGPLVTAIERKAERTIAKLRQELEAAKHEIEETRAARERVDSDLARAKREAEKVPALVDRESALLAEVEGLRGAIAELQFDVKELEEELATRSEGPNGVLPVATATELDALLADLIERIGQGRAALQGAAIQSGQGGGPVRGEDITLLVNTPTSLQTEILTAISGSRRVFVYQVQFDDASPHDLIAVSPQYVGDSLPSRMRMLREQGHLMDGKRLREDVLVESLAALGVVAEPARASGRVERVVRTMLLLDRQRLEARLRQCELEVPEFRGILNLSPQAPGGGDSSEPPAVDDGPPF